MAKQGKSHTISIWRKIPFVESMFSISEQLGITPLLKIIGAIVGGLIAAMAAYVWSNLEPWALILIGISAVGITGWTIERVLLAYLRSKQLRGMETIDRIELAEEMEAMSHNIFALLAEHEGPMKAAWWADAENRNDSFATGKHREAQSKLVEKYGERHLAKSWQLILKAKRVVSIGDDAMWPLRPSSLDSYSIPDMGHLLSNIAAKLRYGEIKKELADGPK
jgi:hypothetical protein